VLVLLGLCLAAPAASAQTNEELRRETRELQQQLQEMEQRMQNLQKELEKNEQKLDETEKEQKWNTEDIKDMQERLSKAERHAAADKVEFSISLEPRLWSIHTQDTRTAFPVLQEAFPFIEGVPFTKQQVQTLLTGGFSVPQLTGGFGIPNDVAQQLADLENPPEVDVDNHAIRTLRFRLRMDAELNENLRFAGRLAAYKVFGDSTGINFNKSGFQDISFDGTTASNPHGNTIRLERAYFIYSNQFGQVPWSISLGRRPSTEGPPLQYKNNLPVVGGSPHAHTINWEFDGASLNFNLEEVVGIPGFDFKLCYGSGFENQYGTSSAFLAEPATDDVDFFGAIGTLYQSYIPQADTDLHVSYNVAFAPNITDGFTGLTVFPFTVNKDPVTGNFSFLSNDFGAVSRFEPQSKIGDWYAVDLLTEATLMEGNLDLFLSGAWSRTEAEKVSEIPLFEMLGMSLLSSQGELEDHDGWSIYTGGRYFVRDWGTKLGLEYNYGSKYWFNVTGAEDNLIGSKLSTRGHVVEPYLIQQIIGDNFFVRLGAQLYWFEYSGSGFPLGEPVDVDEVTGLDTIFPVIDTMQQYYLSVEARF
jgi:hypothetical protein